MKFYINRLWLIFISLTSIHSIVSAQSEKRQQHKTFKTRITLIDEKKITGMLYLITDSSIIIYNYTHRKYVFDTISYPNLLKLTINRRGAAGKGFGIGVATSIGIGILSAVSNNDEDGSLENLAYIVTGIVLSPIVGVAGAVIGNSSRKEFLIYSDYENFVAMKIYIQDHLQKSKTLKNITSN